MSYLVTAANTVLCSHGGRGRATLPNARVRVGGEPTATQSAPYLVEGCPFVTPASNPLPCLAASWLTGALRLRSAGQPLLLTNSDGITTPNGVPVHILPAQARVRGQ
ncbi:hypothetical protein [Microbulbifer taiwanensis]|uniref:Uncharacterized protein n=1 Tax=Microbulbifer taiwanensis TaxID=986746 RepID=A0ABW1YGA4_9GAMM|nr:hypothetical protein [Microbulbifer taiwanensis]